DVDRFPAGQIRPEFHVPGHVGEAAVQLNGVPDGVDAEDPCGAGGRSQQAEKDADGGGLPGSVRAEEAVDFTRFDGEVEAVQGPHLAVVLDEVLDLDDGGHWGSPSAGGGVDVGPVVPERSGGAP